MNILKLAWDNLWYNRTRTILNVLLIVVAFTSLMFISGYNNYSKDGLMLSVVDGNGSVVIADISYWNVNSEKVNIMNSDDISVITKKLDTYENVLGYQKKLDVSGLIGTENKSKFFMGHAYEDVSKMLKSVSLKKGSPIFNDDFDTVILGVDLADYLNISYDEDTYLNTLSDFGYGLSLGSFLASGSVSFNNSYADSSMVYFPLPAIYNVFNIENGSAHNLIVYLDDYNKATEMKNELNEYYSSSNLPYEARDWKDLNEFIISIIDMNDTNYFIALFILGILVFFAIMQTLTTSFLERLSEFGTLRAIGINIKNITLLLFLEIILLVILSTITGIIVSYLGATIFNSMGIKFTPPTATEGYPLGIVLKFRDCIFIFVWTLCVSMLAGIYPIYKVVKLRIIEVIKYV